MNLCDWKTFLRTVELLTAALIASNIAAYGLLITGRVLARSLEPFVAVSGFVFMLFVLVPFLLLSEAGRVPKTVLKKWSLAQLALRFGWCPKWLMVISWSIAVAFALALPGGRVYWNFADPLTERAASVFIGIDAMFLSVFFPVLVSASRMPGTYLQAARRMSVGPNNALQGDRPRPTGSDRA